MAGTLDLLLAQGVQPGVAKLRVTVGRETNLHEVPAYRAPKVVVAPPLFGETALTAQTWSLLLLAALRSPDGVPFDAVVGLPNWSGRTTLETVAKGVRTATRGSPMWRCEPGKATLSFRPGWTLLVDGAPLNDDARETIRQYLRASAPRSAANAPAVSSSSAAPSPPTQPSDNSDGSAPASATERVDPRRAASARQATGTPAKVGTTVRVAMTVAVVLTALLIAILWPRSSPPPTYDITPMTANDREWELGSGAGPHLRETRVTHAARWAWSSDLMAVAVRRDEQLDTIGYLLRLAEPEAALLVLPEATLTEDDFGRFQVFNLADPPTEARAVPLPIAVNRASAPFVYAGLARPAADDTAYRIVRWRPGEARMPDLAETVVFLRGSGPAYDVTHCQPTVSIPDATEVGVPVGRLRQGELPVGAHEWVRPETVARCRAMYQDNPEHELLLGTVAGLVEIELRPPR